MELELISNRAAIGIICAVTIGSVIHTEYRMAKLESKIDNLQEIIRVEDKLLYTQSDIDCLTKNIYYESGVESREGKYAVAHVTVNRMKTGHWGNSVCKVVYSPKQFSWTQLKHLPKPDKHLWAESQKIALDVLQNGARVRGLQQGLYYHATYIRTPKWVDNEYHAITIGQHRFYNQAKNSNVYIKT